MKYGILFLIISLLLTAYAVSSGGWFILFLWPALSFGVVASAYLGLGAKVFGRSKQGKLSPLSVVVLFPYLAFLWLIWHVVRILSREPALNMLTERVYIGRRLLSHELPAEVTTVVDLTCEFMEPTALREARRYIACPMLDAASLEPDALADQIRELASLEDDTIFIHCAQGHGRTGLISALLLLARGHANSADDAVAKIKSARPLVGLNGTQMKMLKQTAELLQTDSSDLLSYHPPSVAN